MDAKQSFERADKVLEIGTWLTAIMALLGGLGYLAYGSVVHLLNKAPLNLQYFVSSGTIFAVLAIFTLILLKSKDLTFRYLAFFLGGLFGCAFSISLILYFMDDPQIKHSIAIALLVILIVEGVVSLLSMAHPLASFFKKKSPLGLYFTTYLLEILLYCAVILLSFYTSSQTAFLLVASLLLLRSSNYLSLAPLIDRAE